MKHNPLISIVIPAYNCEKYVEETFKSILNQTYENWEIIFVNDGSTDNTLEILNKLSAKQSITIVEQDNGKQGKARNNGIRHANGDWIAFLDADDIWTPNKLEFQLEQTINSGADLSFTDGFICLRNDMKLREFKFGVEDMVYSGDDGIQLFHGQNRIPTSTVLVKKAVIESLGGFPEELDIQNCEDYYLWTNLLANGFTFLGINKPMLLYRVYPDSATGNEIKVLYPLLNCLIRLPGKHKKAIRLHLHETLKKFLELIESKEQFINAKPLLLKTIKSIYSGIKLHVIAFALNSSKRLFISLIWRITPN
jgi:teichuronic acid biosynthesis glycosyltransferase TuaG